MNKNITNMNITDIHNDAAELMTAREAYINAIHRINITGAEVFGPLEGKTVTMTYTHRGKTYTVTGGCHVHIPKEELTEKRFRRGSVSILDYKTGLFHTADFAEINSIQEA